MNLDIPSGERCFIDANILLYQLTQNPPFTQRVETFLHRVSQGDILGFTTSIVISEVLHKLMLAEARAPFPQAGRTLPYLQKHPHAIGQLLVFPQATAKPAKIGLTLLPVGIAEWLLTGQMAVRHSLFTNDACAIAMMQIHNIQRLVTNDSDFDGITGIIVHKPV